jgi:hypothetical protein
MAMTRPGENVLWGVIEIAVMAIRNWAAALPWLETCALMK